MIKTYLIVVLFILICGGGARLSAQTASPESGQNSNVSLERAKTFIAEGKHEEARSVLKTLIKRFPNDYEIRGLYFEMILKLENHKVIIAEGERALAVYNLVPVEKRTESFYKNFKKAAFGARQFKQYWRISDEWGRKFPKSSVGRRYRSKKALEENVPKKDAKIFEALMEEAKGKPDIIVHYRNYFLLVLNNLATFGKQKVIHRANEWERLIFENLGENIVGRSNYGKQSMYINGVLEIANRLRPKFPKESLRFSKKGVMFFEAFNVVNDLLDYKAIFKEAVFQSYISLSDWRNALKKGRALIKQLSNVPPNQRINEAKLRRDLGVSLEKVKQISRAREQFYIAFFLDRSFQNDWREFNLRHPFKDGAKAVFEKSTRLKFKRFLDSREATLKANVLKLERKGKAADFSLTGLNGTIVSLKDYKGKVVVLNFWATWCLPCEFELRELNIAYKKYANDPRVAFVIVSTDGQREKVPIVVNERNYNFPVFYVGKNTEKDFKINSVPRLFILDQRGNIRFQINTLEENGEYYRKNLDWMIEAILKTNKEAANIK